ncbi:pirin family protein [Paraglaciecola sp.]|uniref:pirin family protein n=1 Tax=Paraglaciecola sp. TaxID=1920173 RepID=UPI00273F0078|nr:pirin family protein [Paraglaciecola sp.]MDP5030234.1 pirin family protein [Paraglaciecola sp.]MDP5040783.1 pirin family protein [Paraglaciecola sp.]
MIEVRAANQRGKANFGWLESHHTFSFGSYHDENHMGHSALRVINDDTVAPGAGFGTHGHRDMEIISFVTQGVIAHKDSMGNVQTLPKGEFQLMSAGTGVTHSEFNASDTEVLKFLQIWVVPETRGGEPGYQQKNFGQAQGLTPVITPTGENGTLKIKQQTRISQLYLAAGTEQDIQLAQGRKAYVHMVEGSLTLNGQGLSAGDGAKIFDINALKTRNQSDAVAIALVFDLP